MIAGLRWRLIISLVGSVVWLAVVVSKGVFWGSYSEAQSIGVMLVALLTLYGFLRATWAVPSSGERPALRALARKGILPAVLGLVIWILATAEAAYQNAIAISCSTGRCSQTAGSSAAFEASVWTVISYLGLGIAVVGLQLILPTLILTKRAIAGDR